MEEEIVSRIRRLSEEFGWQLSIEGADDKSYIECILRRDNLDLSVAIPRHEAYYAYDMVSSGLPRDLYPEAVHEGFTEQARSEEILSNLHKILSGDLRFNPSPWLFNKNRGFIMLPIDGEMQKVYQKTNYFNLPRKDQE